MFMFVLSFYLYSLAVKYDCSLLTVKWKASPVGAHAQDYGAFC